MIKSLTCDINRRIYMLYGPRQRCPESRAAQPGSYPAARTRASARGRRAPLPGLLHLQAPGLSLSGTGSAAQTSGPGWRCQIVVHCEALPKPRRETAHLRCFHRIDLERDCQPCLVGGAPPRGRTWLTGRRVDNGRYGWNINSTDCCRRSWRRLMNCLRLPESGRQSERPPDIPAAIRRF